MSFFDRIANLLVLTTALIPALAPQPKEGWAGQSVLVKRSSTPFLRAFDPAAPKETEPDGMLRAIEYRVTQDKGGRVSVLEHGTTVWVKKDDVIPLADAVGYFTQEIEREPTDSRAHAFRGWAHYRRGKPDEALKDYAEAIRLAPGVSDWRNNRGIIHSSRKDYDKAIADFDEAIRLSPKSGLAYRNRAFARSQSKQYEQAIADYGRASELLPGSPLVYNGLGWLLATCPEAKYRDGKRAVEAARKACELSDWKSGSFLDTLAAAYAEAGDFAEAVKWQEKALAAGDFPKVEMEAARKRLELYRAKKPYRADE